MCPDTLLRSHRELLVRHRAARSRPKSPGRPLTVHSIRALVLRLAHQNPSRGPGTRTPSFLPGASVRSVAFTDQGIVSGLRRWATPAEIGAPPCVGNLTGWRHLRLTDRPLRSWDAGSSVGERMRLRSL
jgi:hypothetical protein